MFGLLTSIFLILGLAEQPRVVSLTPSITQIVREFGVEPVGVSNFCKADKRALRLGGLGNPNLEAIVRLKPDYVFMLGNHDGLSAKLSPFEIVVKSFSNDNVAQIKQSIEQIGLLLDKQQRAEELIKSLDIRQYKINEPLKVVMLVSGDYRTLSALIAAGENSIYGELLRGIGAINLFQGGFAYPSTSLENILISKPDRIVLFLSPGQKVVHEELYRKFNGLSFSVIEDPDLLIPGLNLARISAALYEAIK